MSALDYVVRSVIPTTMVLLPKKMDSRAARAMLIAIGLQESRFEYRHQVKGTAHGFWQFEKTGVRGVQNLVMKNAVEKEEAKKILAQIGYGDATAEERYTAIEHNDVLACLVARRLLWSYPHRLPDEDEPDYAWEYYLATWRPGKPHRATWNGYYKQAWGLV